MIKESFFKPEKKEPLVIYMRPGFKKCHKCKTIRNMEIATPDCPVCHKERVLDRHPKGGKKPKK